MCDYLKYLQYDLEFGISAEDEIKELLEHKFNCGLNKQSKYSCFDYVSNCENIYIELKTRRCNFDKYPDTMIGYNKVKKSISLVNSGKKVYFIFKFEDGIYYYNFEGIINLKWVRTGGRYDRGRIEKNEYYYIPTELLIKI